MIAAEIDRSGDNEDVRIRFVMDVSEGKMVLVLVLVESWIVEWKVRKKKRVYGIRGFLTTGNSRRTNSLVGILKRHLTVPRSFIDMIHVSSIELIRI